MDGTVSVQEVMDREFVGVSEADSVAETAELMLSEGRESVVVVRGGDAVGLVDERDALAAMVAGDDDAHVAEAMSEDVPTVSPDATLAEAADAMSARGTQRLVVTDGAEVVGILDDHDLVTTGPFDLSPGDATDPEVAIAGQADDRAAEPGTDMGYEDQSICEACGSFARDLAMVNGQLLCTDCRDI